MGLKKSFSKDKTKCTVTFTVSAQAAQGAAGAGPDMSGMGGAAGAGQDMGADAGANSDPNVVDADYEVVDDDK